MIRIGNLQCSIGFYQNVLGMSLLRQEEYPDGRFTLAFLGYGSESSHTVLELTYNWDTEHYDLGKAFGHIAIEVDDAAAACDMARHKGRKVLREAGPMMHGTTVIAFIADPDGYNEVYAKKLVIE